MDANWQRKIDGLAARRAAVAAAGGEARIEKQHAAGKLTAAVCAAPTVLAEAGLLGGRRATCYPGMEEKLTGALPCTDSVVRDGTVITSRGVGTSIAFALSVIAYLDSGEHAEEIARRIVYA